MGQGMSGGGSAEEPKGEVQQLGKSKLVVEQIEVIRQREVIKIPHVVYEDVPSINYIVKDEPTTRYVVQDVPTIKYIELNENTTKYNVIEDETIKYITKEVVVEKPIVVDVSYEVKYEKPVIVEKEYTVFQPKDMVLIKELATMLPNVLAGLEKVRNFKLVEDVIKVPKIQYVPTNVERVVWSDVHKCKKCGSLVDADKD